MDKELKQRASESANRMTRAGMTLSAGIMQELIAEAERLGAENVEEGEYIRFLEKELTLAQAGGQIGGQIGSNEEMEQAQELGGEAPQLRELRARHMLLAGKMNN